jgi:hypothetical protein
MEDVEELVVFFMNAPIDQPFSKQIMVNVLCKLNDLPDEDPGALADVEAWLTKTEERTKERWKR